MGSDHVIPGLGKRVGVYTRGVETTEFQKWDCINKKVVH
jgi:hypothetical protein